MSFWRLIDDPAFVSAKNRAKNGIADVDAVPLEQTSSVHDVLCCALDLLWVNAWKQ